MLWRALVWLATVVGLAVAALVALSLLGILHLYSTPSSSMEPTFRCARPGPGCSATEGDRVAVLDYLVTEPGRGDLIAFHTPPAADPTYQTVLSVGFTAMSAIRPDVSAGPMERSRSPDTTELLSRELSALAAAEAAGVWADAVAAASHARSASERILSKRKKSDVG